MLEKMEVTLHDYRTETCLLAELDGLEQAWRDLQTRSDCSFFQSWGWIGSWLNTVVADLDVVVLRVWRDEQLVGLGLFVPRNIKRRFIVYVPAMYLNEYPADHKNMVIEYNGLLVARDHESHVYAEAVNHLLDRYKAIDEFHFGAIAETPDLDWLRQSVRGHARALFDEESVAWQVDLKSIEPGIDAFIATLSKNRRTQLRRSLRLYEQQGPLRLVEAQDPEQALAFFGGLKLLHTQRRQQKGEGGAFANAIWEGFHHTLIESCFSAGQIQLIQVSTPQTVIGYLYNFIWRDRVYVLQTGFAAGTDKRDLPGYVVHVLAIAHNRDRGMAVYDLMHGDALYKQILCKQSTRLVWAVVQRHKLKFRIENGVVGIARRIRGVLK